MKIYSTDSREHLENIGEVLSDGGLGLSWLEELDLEEPLIEDFDSQVMSDREKDYIQDILNECFPPPLEDK